MFQHTFEVKNKYWLF